ncbi:hypothetical protein VPH35_004255 [Triticum aestivum]
MMDVARVAPRKKRRQRKKKKKTKRTATLPNDVVLNILARVADDVATLFRCAVSCKRFRALVADPSFLRRRWPEGARHPCSLLGFIHDTWIYGTTAFVPVPRSPLGSWRRSLGSFFPTADDLFHDAVPLASRSGLLLVFLRTRPDCTDMIERRQIRLAVCNPLAGTWDKLPPLHEVASTMSNAQCAILTDRDHCPKGQQRQKPLPRYKTFFKVIVIMVEYSGGPYKIFSFSSAESSWSEPRKCFEHLKYRFIHANHVVSRGKVHWLIHYSGNFGTLELDIETGHLSITQFSIPPEFFQTSFTHAPVLSVATDGDVSLIFMHKNFLRLHIFTHRHGDEGRGNGLADMLHTEVIELKHKPPRTIETLYMYLGEKSAALLVTDRRSFMRIVNLETGTIDVVTATSGNLKEQTVMPFEIDWPAFFMSSLEAH